MVAHLVLSVKVFTVTHKAPCHLPYLLGFISHYCSYGSLQFSLSGLTGVPHTCQVHSHLMSFALAIISNSSCLHGSPPLFLQIFAQMSFPSEGLPWLHCLNCNIMDLESIVLREVSQKQKDNTIWCHSYVESKIWHKLTYLQYRNGLTDIENRIVVAKGKGQIKVGKG